eukprot:jgi/Astpho2/6567/fgenesh1_pg.00100_%23_4_t
MGVCRLWTPWQLCQLSQGTALSPVAMRVKAMKQEAAHADQLQLLQSQLKEIAREKEAVLLAHDRVQVQMGRMETAASESSGKVSAVLTRLAAAEVQSARAAEWKTENSLEGIHQQLQAAVEAQRLLAAQIETERGALGATQAERQMASEAQRQEVQEGRQLLAAERSKLDQLQALRAQELDARARLMDAEARAARAGADADAAEARLAAAARSLEERTAAVEAARAVAALEQENVASGSAQLLALGQKIQKQSEAVAATSQQLDVQKAEMAKQQQRLTMQAATLAAKEKQLEAQASALQVDRTQLARERSALLQERSSGLQALRDAALDNGSALLQQGYSCKVVSSKMTDATIAVSSEDEDELQRGGAASAQALQTPGGTDVQRMLNRSRRRAQSCSPNAR